MTTTNPHLEKLIKDVHCISQEFDLQAKIDMMLRKTSAYQRSPLDNRNTLENYGIISNDDLYLFIENAPRVKLAHAGHRVSFNVASGNDAIHIREYTSAIIGPPVKYCEENSAYWNDYAGLYAGPGNRIIDMYMPSSDKNIVSVMKLIGRGFGINF